MVVTVIAAIAVSNQYSESTSSSSSIQDAGNIWGFKWSGTVEIVTSLDTLGFGTMFTSTAFALTMHYSISNLTLG